MRRLHTRQTKSSKVLGLTFARMILDQVREEVATDHLLVSTEAVRMLDASV